MLLNKLWKEDFYSVAGNYYNWPFKLLLKSLFCVVLFVVVQLLSLVQLFATPWTVAHQAPLSMEFPRQEYWNELPFLSLEDLPDSGVKLCPLHCRWILYH